ncbi:MAG TPA: acetate--CoA ligase, partial [Planctomycetes bacterium]|nr:acetate--CoA ligase [Planctomycetota bacterium]
MADPTLDEAIQKPTPGLLPNLSLAELDAGEAPLEELSGLPGGGLNIAYEAVVRHAAGPLRDRVAFRFLGRKDEVAELSYGQLDEQSARFAGLLAELGVARGERVFLLAGRIPELYVAVLGALRHGAVVSPLFAAFGPEPIQARLEIGAGKVLVTTSALYKSKVKKIRAALPALEHVLVVGEPEKVAKLEGVVDLRARLAEVEPRREVAPTQPEDPALLHFTSGTTGKPKGALHVHQAVQWHRASAAWALDLHPDDVFWCTADPGWVTGMSYGIVAPLVLGLTSIVDEADFNAERWYRILAEQRVTVWYTAPTAVRMLMKVGDEAAREQDLSALRFVASVGEPLNPEAVRWGVEALGLPIHDNWWQTETGGIMIANTAAMPIKPGSMGRPLPGIEVSIVRKTPEGLSHLGAGEEGELALRRGWPSMVRTYLNEEERYQRCFVGEWYLSGDLARRDADGYVWFVGRADDVINTSGHLVGPFEVESALMEHPAVAEVGVIGKPDPVAMELVKAFVALKPGHEDSDELRQELFAFARKRLGSAVAPKELEVVAGLPKTRSGKIMRRILRALAAG